MSTVTINCTRDTYISKYYPNSNNTGASKLLTDYYSDTGIIGQNTIQAALLQFSIPKEIQYKQITKAVIHYYYGTDRSTTYSKIGYVPYLIDNTTSNVTFNTVAAYGTLGERKTVSKRYSTSAWMSEDITDIFTNNLTNGIFSLFVEAGGYTPDDVASSYVISYIGGIAGSNGAYLVITYEDVEQLPPTITYPVDVYVRQGEGVLFSWVYNSLTAAKQASVTLEWKAASDTSYNVLKLTQTTQSYLANIDFPAGTIDWRIKVTNDIGESSAYASAQFVVIGKPAIPVITNVKNDALTEITWNASDQCVYEIQITDAAGKNLVSELVHSGEMSYRPQMFLDNGVYNIRLRTKNSIELWSDYTSKTVTISATIPAKPELTLYHKEDSIDLIVVCDSNARVAILRAEQDDNYEIIAFLPVGVREYTDKEVTPNIWYKYKARAYVNGYNDSEYVAAAFNYQGFFLQTDADILHLTKTTEGHFLAHSETLSRNMAVSNFAGRELPVMEFGEHVLRKVQKQAFVTFEEKEILDRIAISEKVFYRDAYGNKFRCAIGTPQYTKYMDKGYQVSFDLTEVAKEEVELNV